MLPRDGGFDLLGRESTTASSKSMNSFLEEGLLATSAEDGFDSQNVCGKRLESCPKPVHEESLLASQLVMRAAGVCLPRDSQKWPTVLLGVIQWGLIIAIIFFLLIDDNFSVHDFRCYNILATLVWCLHSTLMFSIVAKDAVMHGGQLEVLIWEMASEDFILPGTALDSDTLINPTHGYRNLKRLTMKISGLVVLCGLINWVVSFATFTNNFTSRMLPTGDNVPANAFVVGVWFFYCVGWFLPIYFVRVPCSLLMCRINRYIKYLSKSATCIDFNLIEAMRLYDCLCKSNRRLKSSVGFMVTTSIGLLSVHGVLLLLVGGLFVICVTRSFHTTSITFLGYAQK